MRKQSSHQSQIQEMKKNIIESVFIQKLGFQTLITFQVTQLSALDFKRGPFSSINAFRGWIIMTLDNICSLSAFLLSLKSKKKKDQVHK